jgi:sterol desaturase/sphingolipid hydroxylase (fatty acid hydroxylase superfamily)
MLDYLIANMIPIALGILLFVPLEHMFALKPEQGILRKNWQLDAFYFVFNRLPIAAGFLLVTLLASQLAAWSMPDSVRSWVHESPFWLQLIAVLLITDVCYYFMHMCFHKVPFLWRFHAVHHSIEEMDWIAGSRIHPIDQVGTKGVALILIIALNFSDPVLATFGFFYFVHSHFVHSNTRISLGPLEWIVASPHFHHWHHADQKEAIDKNFASQLSVLDWIFGTMYMPDDMPKNYGTNTPVPKKSYFRQMMFPFMKSKRAENNTQSAPLMPSAEQNG